jgi:hypothetical protein
MEKRTGIIEQIENIKEHAYTNDKGKRVILYTTHLIIDGKTYGVSEYDKPTILKRIEGLGLRDKIEFNHGINKKGFWVIDGTPKVLEHLAQLEEHKPAFKANNGTQKTLSFFCSAYGKQSNELTMINQMWFHGNYMPGLICRKCFENNTEVGQ